MASILPREPLAKIGWFENHNGNWNTNAVALGTSTTEISALVTKTAAARAAYDAQQQAQQAAKAATLDYHLAVATMVDAGNDVLKKIKAKAAVDGPSIYALAEIPAPAPPSPKAPPGQPTDFKVGINPDGALLLSWKCPNPAGSGGTVYQISRRIGAEGPFVMVGTAGQRKFTDDTLPAGAAQVTYRILPMRSTVEGSVNHFTVTFGIPAGGGAMMATIVEGGAGAPKLAA